VKLLDFALSSPLYVAYSLAERTTLADGDLIAFLNTESGGHVSSQVGVSLLISGVLGNEVEVFSSDDQGTVHLSRDNGASQDAATDGDLAGEGALLVCSRIVSACSFVPGMQPFDLLVFSLESRRIVMAD
jgi:hypothetical protein